MAIVNKNSIFRDGYDPYDYQYGYGRNSYEAELAQKYEYELLRREQIIRQEYEQKIKAIQGRWTSNSTIATNNWQTTSSTSASVNTQFNTPLPSQTKTELQKMQDEVEAYCKAGRRNHSSGALAA